MAKQEKIRVILEAWRDDRCLFLSEDKPCLRNALGDGYCSSDDGSYNCLMLRLRSQGLVLKVERDEPFVVHTNNFDVFPHGNTIFIANTVLERAGYGAFESLREETV